MNIKGYHLGSGEPVICVAVTETSTDAIIEKIKFLTEFGAQAIEWRVDYFDGQQEVAAVCEILEAVSTYVKQTIFLTTYRTRAEGGQGDLDTEAYEALIVAMAENGVADFVDVELDSSADAQALFARVHEAGGKVIASHHDFEKTPATVDMISMMSDMYELGADVAKLAVMPQSFSDVVAVLDATVVVHQSYPNQPKITISMGKLGAITRLLGESVGSCLTFGTVGRASAPGQMEYKNVARALDSIHVCLSEE